MDNIVKKSGRPKKLPKEVPVNESAVELEMEQGGHITVNQIQASLRDMYAKLLGNNISYADTDMCNLNRYNPFLQNQRLKMLNNLPADMPREDLMKALSSPQDHETSLRSEGWAMASKQYMYYKILRLACDIPMYKYYTVPELLEEKKYKDKSFISEDKFVHEWLEKFDVVNTFKRIALEVKREGKQAYVLRNSIYRDAKGERHVNYAAMQKLPSNYIKLVKIGEHGFIVSFNMLLFMNPAFCVEQYPDFIQDIWNDMMSQGAITKDKNGKYKTNDNILRNYSYEYRSQFDGSIERLGGNLEIINQLKNGRDSKEYFFWAQLPQDRCYTFSSDNSNPWAVPDTSGLLLALDELADYDTLQGLIESSPLTAILTAEAEMIDNPNPGQDQTALSGETIVGLQNKFNESTSTNLEAFYAPLKNFKLLSLPSQPNGSEISTNATKNVITRAGLGGLLITTDKPAVSQVKAAQALAESEVQYVTSQFESVLNMIIKNMIGCEYKWTIHLWGNVFSFTEEVKRDKELFVAGATFVLPKLASAYDLNLRDTRAIENYIASLDIYKDFQTVTQASQTRIEEQQNNDSESKSQGRPTMSDDEIDNDNTAASKDTGLDTADMR